MGKIFVRARPSKIAITETYYYEGFLGDNPYWRFDKAEGEIKVEFPFDGYYNGHFGRTALEDLSKQDPHGRAKRALTGHLAIVEAGKTSWKEAPLRRRTIPIILDVENIRQKLKSSRMFSIKFLYQPDEPDPEPFLLSDIKLTDQEPFEDPASFENKPQYYPYLTLSISFKVPVKGDLLDAGNLSQQRIKEIIKAIKEGQTQEVKALPGDCSAEHISERLFELARTDLGGTLLIGLTPDGEITGLSESDEKAVRERITQAVFMKDSPIPITRPVVKTVDVDGEDKKIAIIIVPPGLGDRHDQSKPPGRPNISLDETIDRTLVNDLLRNPEKRNVVFLDKKLSDKSEDTQELAKIFAGLANEGGYILLGVRSNIDEDNYLVMGLDFTDIYTSEQIVEKTLRQVKPLPRCQKNYVRVRRNDGNLTTILVFKVSGDYQEVYSFANNCWQIDTNRRQFKINELEPEAIFKLLTQKYARFLHRAIVRGEPPRIPYGYIKWPYTVFDRSDWPNIPDYRMIDHSGKLPGTSRAEHRVKEDIYLPSKYDPSQSAMEWHNVPFDNIDPTQFFETVLRLEIRDPEDLRDPEENWTTDLAGHFEILLGPPMLSDLEIEYFNALGEKLEKPQQERIITQQTKIVLDVTLRISDLFKKRDFSPYRRLEFEGVLPEESRNADVEEALNDCGLRVVRRLNDGPIVQKGLARKNIWYTESRSETGKFTLWLIVTNFWYELEREISYGERTDKMPIPTGRMMVEILGAVEGAENRQLTELMNNLQSHLKERLKYVRVG